MTNTEKKYSNYQVMTMALYNAGGNLRYVNTEDVAIEADKLAPGRFRWAKYKDMISDAIIRDGLCDARKEKNGELVLGSTKDGWILTKEGMKFCKEERKSFDKTKINHPRLTIKEREWRSKEKNRLLNEVAYKKYYKGDSSSITKNDIKSFFRLNDYIVGEARQNKIQITFNNFSEDRDLGNTVKHIMKLINDKNYAS